MTVTGTANRAALRPLLCAALVAALAAGGAAAACSEDTAEFRGKDGAGGKARFTVEIADEPAEVQRGLMHRESMPKSAGMLFIYDRAQPIGFWMRNTLIPLDMIFMGADGTVHKVHENAVPLDETPIFGGREIQYVLEINGGLARMLGIGPGSELRHPAIDQDIAAWPCAE